MAMRVTEGLVRRAGGLTDGFLQNQWPMPRTGCNVRRCTFAYLQGFQARLRTLQRGFWTSRGIFAQRWGL